MNTILYFLFGSLIWVTNGISFIIFLKLINKGFNINVFFSMILVMSLSLYIKLYSSRIILRRNISK